MTQLPMGMYGSLAQPGIPRFGIRLGQPRGCPFITSSVWYNGAGERLGWGDLSVEDLHRIKAELEGDALFAILDVPAQSRLAEAVEQSGLDFEAPGVEFVAENARYVIVAGRILVIDRACNIKVGLERELDGLGEVRYVRPEELKDMMTASLSV